MSTNCNFITVEKIAEKINKPELLDLCLKKSMLLCINAERNIGKTTCWLNYLFDSGRVCEMRKVGYLRIKDNQIRRFRGDFNNRFKGRYEASGGMFYKLSKTVKMSKDEEEIITYEREECVGYYGSVNCFAEIKSVEASNIKYILFDEYNEDTSLRNLYTNFINLITTLGRFNEMLIVMLGNRDTANNDFMVKWKVLPQENTYGEDSIIEFDDNCFFMELGTKQFEALGNKDTIWRRLARFDYNADRYLSGGYAKDVSMYVVPFDVIAKPSFEPLFMVVLKGRPLVIGSFKHSKYGNKQCYILCEDKYAIEKAKEENLEMFSLDASGYQNGDAKLNNGDSIESIIKSMLLAHRRCELFYDGFDIMNDFCEKMLMVKF